MVAPTIDIESARRYLRETLPAGESIEIESEDVLDAAAAVIVAAPKVAS